MRTALHIACGLCFALVLIGCGGSALSGKYTASVEALSPSPSPAYERVKQGMVTAPETLELKPDGSFETRRGDEVIWKGQWKAEGSTLSLRATSVKGVAVASSLQDEVKFSLRQDGSIIDDRTKGENYQRVFRR